MILAILQARMSSGRFPGKVLKPILGTPMVARQIERVMKARKIDKLVLATSVEHSDDVIANYCIQNNIVCHRGPLDDALTRFAGAIAVHGPADHIVRLTGDCPLTDWSVIDECIALHCAGDFDFTSNAIQRTYPKGLDVEVLTQATFTDIDRNSMSPFEREHVTQFIYDSPGHYKIGHLIQDVDESARRWVVDTPADFAMVDAVYSALYPTKQHFDSDDIRTFLRQHPDVEKLNKEPTA